MKASSFVILLLCALLVSCVSDAKLKYKHPVKLVVFAAISPDDTITDIKVRYNAPLGSTISWNSPNVYSTAKVKIMSEGAEYIVPFDANRNSYRLRHSLFEIKPGATYSLVVDDQNGLVVTSETKVPLDTVRNITVEFDSILDLNSDGEKRLAADMSWDKLNGVNFYKYDITDTSNSYYSYSFNSYYEQVEHAQLSDEDQQGSSRTKTGFRYLMLSSNMLDEAVNARRLNASVYTINEELYRYFNYVAKQDDDDLFIQDPYTVYTNIKGGLGVFGAYRKNAIIVKNK